MSEGCKGYRREVSVEQREARTEKVVGANDLITAPSL